jgi:hypothetical protein
MGNISRVTVQGVGTVNLKFTSGKTVQLRMCITFPPSIKISSADLFYVEMVLS